MILASRYGLQIRAATVADAREVAELMVAVGQAVPVDRLAARLEALRQAPGTALIALEWGPPSGLVVVQWLHGLTAPPLARIGTLLVGPDSRRRGIGRALLKAASQAARSAGCDIVELCAPPEDPSLDGFCRAAGFDPAGTSYRRSLRKKSSPA